MRIAIVHDYLIQIGGAERVVETLCEMFPEAPIFTLLYDDRIMNGIFKSKTIKSSFLQKIPFAKKYHRYFLALMPFAIGRFDLSGYDLIISSSSSYAKGFKKPKNSLHICYCHTPLRYAWDDTGRFIRESNYPRFVKLFIPFLIEHIKKWDLKAASGVDYFIANSNFIADKIKRYYKRDAIVIYPPVGITNNSQPATYDKERDYYLIVSRLLPYKRIDIAIQAFNELARLPAGKGLKLKIVGDGPERKNLEKMAGKNIEFLGSRYDEELIDIYGECKAFIFPQEEDFGITAVEAQMAGRPVIAFQAGGALESVVDGKTGVFFKKQNKDSLIDAIRRFDKMKFSEEEIMIHAQKFSKENFKKKIKEFIDDKSRNTQHKARNI